MCPRAARPGVNERGAGAERVPDALKSQESFPLRVESPRGLPPARRPRPPCWPGPSAAARTAGQQGLSSRRSINARRIAGRRRGPRAGRSRIQGRPGSQEGRRPQEGAAEPGGAGGETAPRRSGSAEAHGASWRPARVTSGSLCPRPASSRPSPARPSRLVSFWSSVRRPAASCLAPGTFC